LRRPPPFNAIGLAVLCALLTVSAAGAVEVPGSAGRLTLGGYLDGLAVVDTGAGPRQRPGALLLLGLDATGPRWLRGRMELKGRVGGPFEGAHPGIYSLSHVFQNHSPSFEVSEAYVDVLLRRADLRMGIQKIAWGKLDGAPPTDVLNPRDFHDPVVEDFEERKIGIPALLGTYYLPDVERLALSGVRASLAWVPIAVPPRLALLDERWFPESSAPQDRLVIPPRQVRQGIGLDIPALVRVRLGTRNHRPSRQLDTGGVGVRLGGTWRETDWDLYHYTGPETAPDLDLRSDVVLVSLDPLERLVLRAPAVLRQTEDVIHMTGADAATPLGGFTVRAEAAYFDGRPYLRLASDLVDETLRNLPLRRIGRELTRRGRSTVPTGDLFPTFDALEWGVGADYLWRGFQPLVQLNQIVILDDVPRLVIHDPETRLSGTLRKRVLGERLELELRGVYAIEREAWYVFPRVSYSLRDDLRLRVGYLALGGPRASLIGQFRDNDEVVFQARWSF
jgi:hypothetical protein